MSDREGRGGDGRGGAMRDPPVIVVREGLAQHGYHIVPCVTGERRPIDRNWPQLARSNDCLKRLPDPRALNTGIATAGLRAVDQDVDDPGLAEEVADLVFRRLGEAPTRFRRNSPRRCALYRAAVGEPCKRQIVGPHGRIEVLGAGQQLLAFGTHPSGAELEWTVSPAFQIARHKLPAVSEEQITALLTELAPMVGASTSMVGAPDALEGDAVRVSSEPQTTVAKLAEWLKVIPNDVRDWQAWNNSGLSIFAASGGSEEGRRLFHEWSAKNSCYDSKLTDARWASYRRCPPTKIGAGSLCYAADQARQAKLGNFLDLGVTRPDGRRA
jgi:hypothetical protein